MEMELEMNILNVNGNNLLLCCPEIILGTQFDCLPHTHTKL